MTDGELFVQNLLEALQRQNPGVKFRFRSTGYGVTRKEDDNHFCIEIDGNPADVRKRRSAWRHKITVMCHDSPDHVSVDGECRPIKYGDTRLSSRDRPDMEGRAGSIYEPDTLKRIAEWLRALGYYCDDVLD